MTPNDEIKDIEYQLEYSSLPPFARRKLEARRAELQKKPIRDTFGRMEKAGQGHLPAKDSLDGV